MPLSLISVDGQWPARPRTRWGHPQKCRGRERDHMISFGVAATTEAIAAKLSGGERRQWKIGLQHGHSFLIRFLLLPFADSCSHIIYVGASKDMSLPLPVSQKVRLRRMGRENCVDNRSRNVCLSHSSPLHDCPELLQLLHFFFMPSSSVPRAPRRAGICETVEGRLPVRLST